MRLLKKTIEDTGGVPAMSRVCGKTPRVIYKWLVADALPRTEYRVTLFSFINVRVELGKPMTIVSKPYPCDHASSDAADASPKHRFNPDNVHEACGLCNHLSGNILGFLPALERRIGDEAVAAYCAAKTRALKRGNVA